MQADFTERFLKGIALVGTGAFVIGVSLTMTDIGLRSFSTLTIRGVIDIMQLCVLTGAMLAIPYGFLADQHVSIDLFVQKFSPQTQLGLRALAAFLGAAFLAGVFWFSLQQALTEYAGGDRSQTIGIPMIWYWIPLLFGVGLSVLVNLLMALRLLRGGLPKR